MEADEAFREYRIVMCFLECTHDSDPTSVIVSPIPIPTKSKSLVPPRDNWNRSESKSSRVVRSRSESFGVVSKIQNTTYESPKSFGAGVVQIRLETLRVV